MGIQGIEANDETSFQTGMYVLDMFGLSLSVMDRMCLYKRDCTLGCTSMCRLL